MLYARNGLMSILSAYSNGGVADRIALALFGWKLAQATRRNFVFVWPANAACGGSNSRSARVETN